MGRWGAGDRVREGGRGREDKGDENFCGIFLVSYVRARYVNREGVEINSQEVQTELKRVNSETNALIRLAYI